jgi:hypothetical protein
MRILQGLATAAMALFLAGCNSMFGNPTSVARLDVQQRSNPATSATIILSAGVREVCFSSYPVMVDLVGMETGKPLFHFTANNEFIKPQLDENHGFVHAANVPPGKYYLTLDVWAKQMTSAPVAYLTLAPGDLVYLGEFFIDSGCAGFGNRDAVVIRDRSQRDLAKAAELNPTIDPAKVEVRVLRFVGQTGEPSRP